MIRLRSIGVLIPLMILVGVLAVRGIELVLQLRYQQDESLEQTRVTLQSAAARFAKHAELQLASDPGLLEEELAMTAIELSAGAMLVDSTGRVIMANDSRWRQKTATALLPPTDGQLLKEAIQTARPGSHLSPDSQILNVMFPVKFPAESHELSAFRTGAVLLRVDMQPRLEQALARELRAQLPFVSALTLIALLISGWIYLNITRPLAAIVSSSRSVGDRGAAEIDVRGSSEVRLLSVALNQMTERLRSQQDELLQSELNLRQRMKELSCLYDTFRITERDDIDLEEKLRKVVERIPQAMRYPAACSVYLRCEAIDQVFEIGTRSNSELTISSQLIKPGGPAGELWVSYDPARIDPGAPIFGPELQTLLDTVADRLGATIEVERTRIERQDNLSLVRGILEQAPIAIELADPETMRLVEANETSCRLLGYRRDERIGQELSEFQVAMNPEELDATVRQIIKTGGASFETRHRRKTGELLDARVQVTLLTMRGKQYLLATWEDITEQLQMRRALEDNRAALEQEVERRTEKLHALTTVLSATNEEQQALFNASPAGIVYVRKRLIVNLNEALARMFGSTQAAMMNQTTRSWYPDEQTFRDIGRRIQQALETGGYFNELHQLVRADGSRFWAQMSAQAIDPQDLSKGLAGVILDVTAEREAIEAMTQATLIAERAARTKSEFLANMSHEIRTPMNAIIGLTHLLSKTDLNDSQQAYLEKIHGAGDHLMGIINDILDISKIEAGKLSIESVPFAIHKVADDVLGVTAERADTKGLALTFDVAPDVPDLVVGDELRIGQVLINFVSNAIKFTAEGVVHIEAKLQSRRHGRVVIRFEVSDTGIGIAPERRERIFDSFEQADSSTTRRYGGTGLGLTISKQLVRLMNGSIGVDSTPDRGSTFWFTVPLQVARAGEEPSAVNSIEHTDEDIGGAHILLVEDNELNREVATALLADLGVEVSLAEHGGEAVEILSDPKSKGRFDAVLMDLQMPVMDGLTATRAILSLPMHRDLTIIAMTANAMDSDRTACLAAGMKDHLPKPIDPADLGEMLTRWIGKGETVAPAAATGAVQATSEQAKPQVIDRQLGLRQCGGRREMYDRLLQGLGTRHQSFGADFNAAFDAGDREGACRLAHSLKGSAAQLGATPLRAAAEALEHAMRRLSENAAAPAAELAQVGHELQRLSDAVTKAAPASKAVVRPDAPTGAFDVEELERVCLTLVQQFEDDDYDCNTTIHKHRDLLRSAFGSDYRRLAAAVENIDYDGALAVLQSLMTAKGI